jgi:hypothetical protein
MNDMALLCQEAISRSGGLRHTDLAALNHSLRRNINSARGYQRPIELTAHLYRFRTRHRYRDLRFGRMLRVGQDRGLCIFASST